MSKKVNLSFKEGRTFLYIITVGILFILIIISIILYNREKYFDLVLLLLLSVAVILFVLLYLLKINKLNNISFDEQFVYVNFQEKVFKRSEIEDIKYYFFAASFIKFKSDNKKYYFLLEQNELFSRKKKYILTPPR
ncbi:hypothetical protein CJ739_1605 [Mariniflexile rhizosphaerae]|uniref:hypothetical protein n=1 Tax=unclassified Mariniflexile TaxID=2643887 RepID=UPI000CABD423|nr:hypothetical protein [Mariniflexile sp. TRM1-10]AXP80692.1 hypothetical protein CJ739_1605 [Mariniflexile sp. TRM1-10]PLB19761.1 MAG: hypothetical protein TRG1_1288 [Flavobacteriaceae bacterium FS1-H7996/R]